MLIDCAHYDQGRRAHEGDLSIDEAARRAREHDGFVWLNLRDPDQEQMTKLEDAFSLHELAVEDAEHAHQRPKLEDYDGHYFIVLRPARYNDEREVVEFGETHVFIGPGYVIAIQHGEVGDLHGVREGLEQRPELLHLGPAAVVWGILDRVVDEYAPVADGIQNDIEEVERSVFIERDKGDPTTRIYFLKREVVDFYRAVHPLLAPLDSLESGGLIEIDPKLQRYLRDVNDHVKRLHEEIIVQRDQLDTALTANVALTTVMQNDVVRKISGWAAIIAIPTFIASVYGMNFDHMPELHWRLGYPAALAFMFVTALGLYRYFKHVRWL
jgi:magnesium transporter